MSRKTARRAARVGYSLGQAGCFSRIGPRQVLDGREPDPDPGLRVQQLCRIQLLQGGTGIHGREVNQEAFCGPSVPPLEGRLQKGFNQAPGDRPRIRRHLGVRKRPHFSNGWLVAAGQNDRDVILGRLDDLAVKPKSLMPGKHDHRSRSKAAQRELAVRVGPGRGPLGTITPLQDLRTADRLSRAIDHAAADRSQQAKDDRRQLARLFPERDPVAHDQVLPRRSNHDTERRAGQQSGRGLERTVSAGSHRTTCEFHGTRVKPEISLRPHVDHLPGNALALLIDDPARDLAGCLDLHDHRGGLRGHVGPIREHDVLLGQRRAGNPHRHQLITGSQ